MELSTVSAIVLFLFVATQFWWYGHRQAALEDQVYRLNRRLGLMTEAGSPPSHEVVLLLADPKRYVEALKRYRDETGTDYRQARSVLEGHRPRRKE